MLTGMFWSLTAAGWRDKGKIMKRFEIVNKIIENVVVAVIRLKDEKKLLQVVEAIYSGGVKTIEITLTVPNALESLAKLKKEFTGDILVGVGSVLSVDSAKQAIDAGAQFIVSPIFKKEILEYVGSKNLPMCPGAFSPTEIFSAYELGADIVKVFPADVVGMDFFKSIKSPMPQLKLMPTGGVTLTNAAQWLAKGACAVGIGSALVDQKLIENNNYSEVTKNAKTLMDTISSYRSSLKN